MNKGSGFKKKSIFYPESGSRKHFQGPGIHSINSLHEITLRGVKKHFYEKKISCSKIMKQSGKVPFLLHLVIVSKQEFLAKFLVKIFCLKILKSNSKYITWSIFVWRNVSDLWFFGFGKRIFSLLPYLVFFIVKTFDSCFEFSPNVLSIYVDI